MLPKSVVGHVDHMESTHNSMVCKIQTPMVTLFACIFKLVRLYCTYRWEYHTQA